MLRTEVIFETGCHVFRFLSLKGSLLKRPDRLKIFGCLTPISQSMINQSKIFIEKENVLCLFDIWKGKTHSLNSVVSFVAI